MSQGIEAELRLATLLGWTELQVGGQERGFKLPPTWVNGYPPGSNLKDRELVPFWAREDGDAFRLAVQSRIHFAINEDGRGWAEHIDGGDYIEFQTTVGDWAELRLAIVKVAIARHTAAAKRAEKGQNNG
jgi:hypothetical protein